MLTNIRAGAKWLSEREIWLLIPAIALTMFRPTWAPWGLMLCGLLWLVRWVGQGYLTVQTPLDRPIILLLLMMPVTFLATTDFRLTINNVSWLLAGLAVYYGIVNWIKHSAQVALLGLGISAFGLLLSVSAPFIVRWFVDKKQFLGVPPVLYNLMPTLVDDTVHPNMMAGALVMLLPFSFALFITSVARPWPVKRYFLDCRVCLFSTRWFQILIHGSASLVMSIILFLTKSRGGWLAATAVFFLVLVRQWKCLLGLLVLLPVSIVWLASQHWLNTLLNTIATSGTISGIEGRLEVWSRALYMIQDFPFTGVGMGTFQSVANALYPFFLAGPNAEIPHAHNLLLQVGVDLGVPGLVAFIAILILVTWSAMRSLMYYGRLREEFMTTMAWAGLVSIGGMLIHGMVDATTWAVGRGAFVPFIVYGVLIALEQRPQKRSSTD